MIKYALCLTNDLTFVSFSMNHNVRESFSRYLLKHPLIDQIFLVEFKDLRVGLHIPRDVFFSKKHRTCDKLDLFFRKSTLCKEILTFSFLKSLKIPVLRISSFLSLLVLLWTVLAARRVRLNLPSFQVYCYHELQVVYRGL